MAPRSNRKGYLKLSLVSVSIANLSRHVVSERFRFNTLNRATGNRSSARCSTVVTGEPVESEEQIKGYAVAKTST